MEQKKRLTLKQFRVGLDLTQQEMANRMGVTLSRYNNTESGYRTAKQDFWQKLQDAFNISDADMWQLMQQQEGAKR